MDSKKKQVAWHIFEQAKSLTILELVHYTFSDAVASAMNEPDPASDELSTDSVWDAAVTEWWRGVTDVAHQIAKLHFAYFGSTQEWNPSSGKGISTPHERDLSQKKSQMEFWIYQTVLKTPPLLGLVNGMCYDLQPEPDPNCPSGWNKELAHWWDNVKKIACKVLDLLLQNKVASLL